MRVTTILLFACFATTLLAQQPDTIYISARNNQVVFTKDTLRLGTKYIVQVTGGISYWRDSVPPAESDADAAFLFHIPYIPGFVKDTIDSVNLAILWNAGFVYLPCDGSTCTSVPPAWDCGTNNVNFHSINVPERKELFLDRDYFSINGEEFCPRNSADISRHNYVEGITGTGQRAAFQFHDGDGDFIHNAGILQVIVTRVEPLATITHSTLAFGKQRPLYFPKTLGDTMWNSSSPIFPGCASTTTGLSVTLQAFTGDTAADGFHFSGLTVGKKVDIGQGTKLSFTATFAPEHVRTYHAVLQFTTNDPQAPQLNVELIGDGTQGILQCADTLDFGDVVIGTTKQRPLSVMNSGNADLHIVKLQLSSTDTAFSCVDTSAFDLRADSGATLAIAFRPSRLGMSYRTMTMNNDGFGNPLRTITFKGNGVSSVGVASSAVPVNSTISATVSPNPCTTYASLHIESGSSLSRTTTIVRLLDMLGREVQTVYHGVLPFNGNINSIDVSHLAAGTYVLDVATGDGQRCHAMISVAPR